MPRGQVRPHGEGKWRVYAYVGLDPITGKEQRRTEVVPGSKKQAEARLTAILAELDAGRAVASGEHTLGFAIEAFLAHKANQVEPGTLDNYRCQATYVTEKLRAMPVAKVRVEHLELFYAHLLTKGHKRTGGPLGGKSAHNVHTFLYGVFELARRRGWVTVNPAADAEAPVVKDRKPTPARADRLPALFEACHQVHGRRLALYVRVSIAVGNRRSELHGLRWERVDLAERVITLSEVVTRANGRWQVKERLKDGSTAHAVPIGAGTAAHLQALRDEVELAALEAGVAFDPAWFVFSDDPVGERPWCPDTTLERFRRACKAAGMPPRTRLHDLRHLTGTHLTDQRLPVTAVAARLNHASATTTLGIYAGAVDETARQAAEIMERLLDGGP